MQMFSENVDNFRVSASPDFSVSSLPAAVACFSGGVQAKLAGGGEPLGHRWA